MKNNKKITTLIAFFLSLFAIGSLSSIKESDTHEVHASESLLSTPSVVWNNVNYIGKGWAGTVDINGVPQEGYCLLAQYTSSISSTVYTETNVLNMTISGCNVKDHILINGVEAQNVTGATVYVYPMDGIYVYFPASSITFNKYYKYPTVEFVEGLSINGTIKTVATRFEYRGAIKTFGNWVVNPPQAKAISFSGIAGGWNNAEFPQNPGLKHLILTFGQYNVDFLASDKTPNATNRANKAYDIGNNLTINGLSIAQINEKEPNTTVSYAHGYCFLYICYPAELTEITANYAVPTLHINADTEFMDSLLSEVTLKFIGGSWIVSSNKDFKLENPVDNINHSYVDIPYKTTAEKAEPIFGDLTSEGCEIAFNINTGNVDLTNGGAVVHIALYNLTIQINQPGQSIELFRSNNSKIILEQFKGFIYAPNTDYILEIKIVCGAQTTIQFGINHLFIFEHTFNENLCVTDNDPILWVFDVAGTWTIKDYEELKYYTPKIVYSGASSYDFVEGDPVYNFVGIVDTYSLYDSDISYNSISYEYQNGAVSEGKYNAGTWTLNIVLQAEGYPTVTKTVTINVHGKVSTAKISYNGGDEVEVPIGSKLTPPANPSTYREGEYDYVFDGWYFNGAKWDFENDVVEGNMNFIAKYKAVAPHLKVTVNYEGIEKASDSYALSKGSTLPFSVFDMEGASYVVYLNESVITSLTVNEDVVLTVKYTVNFTYVEEKEATCTEEGSTGYWYSPIYAGYTFADSLGKEIKPDGVIPKTGHDIIHLDYQDSTCSEVGHVACYYCENCHVHFSDKDGKNELTEWSIAKKAHTMTHHEHVDATCEEDGSIEYWTCANEPNTYYGDENGTVVVNDITISAFGHDYRAPTYKWISTENGYECVASISCSHCHDVISETQKGTKVVVREATCSREGQICYSVKFNDSRFAAQTKIIALEKLPHSYVFVAETPASETSVGIKEHYECSSCHEYFIKNGDEYLKVDYSDLVYYYSKPEKKGCKGDVDASALILLLSGGAIALLPILKRREAK